MSRPCRRGGLTRVDVIVMLLSVVAILLPALQAAREGARLRTCSNNMRQLGLALQSYVAANGAFPPSSGVTFKEGWRKDRGRSAEARRGSWLGLLVLPPPKEPREEAPSIVSVDGWSWLVLILPYTETDSGQSLYESLDVAHGRPLVEPAGQNGTPHADALRVKLPAFTQRNSGVNGRLVKLRRAGLSHCHQLSMKHISVFDSATETRPLLQFTSRTFSGSLTRSPTGRQRTDATGIRSAFLRRRDQDLGPLKL